MQPVSSKALPLDSAPLQPASGHRRLELGSPVLLIGLVAAAGASLRFSTLDTQSFWYDEGLTAHLVRSSFGPMLSGVRNTEALPPLYFVLAWVWTRVFGDAEIGLRSLSAVAGTLTIPVAYAAAKALAGRRVALIVAVLAAVSPALIFYSQEARPYALLTLFSVASLLYFARARGQPTNRNLTAWAAASALAIASHYFAVFLVIPEVALLLWDPRRRRAAGLAAAVVAATVAALLPLALYQRVHAGPSWISTTDFAGRLKSIPYFFVTGYYNEHPPAAGLIAIAIVCVIALVCVARAQASPERRGALLALLVGGISIVIPLAGKVVSDDYILPRNLLAAWIPLAIFVVAAFATRFSRLLLTGVAAATALSVIIAIHVASAPHDQRDDWRAVARALGPTRQDRVIVIAPSWQYLALQAYRQKLRLMPPVTTVTEIDEVTFNGILPFNAPVQTAAIDAPFRRIASTVIQRFTLTRYEAQRPTVEPRISLTTQGRNGAAPFIEPG